MPGRPRSAAGRISDKPAERVKTPTGSESGVGSRFHAREGKHRGIIGVSQGSPHEDPRLRSR